MAFVFKIAASPVGDLTLVASDTALVAILWPNDDPRRVPLRPLAQDDENAILLETERQLGEYFAGTRQAFDLPLAFSGTAFQRRVWAALVRIPFGETRTYGEIAAELGSPSAVRAVGAANGRNPISIVAPCHRVIGASGHLTGFAGGLATKAMLLTIEGSRYGRAVPKRSRDLGANLARHPASADAPSLFEAI